MAIEREQPWWEDAQDYRSRAARRRTLDERSASRRAAEEEGTSADALRRRRAAAARAAAQQRRARQQRSRPVEYQWVAESPFSNDERGDERERVMRERRARDRSRQAAQMRSGNAVARRPGGRPARRRRSAGAARPERLLLYAALLGLFLVFAAVTNSDAATLTHALPAGR
ncbi:MAG: hypothetical protein M0P31_02325 [Solirubrobacteraceae bacterium]|nr:hypothetical protein [Solirubrobacteraceae bacterium]